MEDKKNINKSYLTLGWRVDTSLAPIYWLDQSATSGGQSNEDLVRVPSESIGCHTSIIAQSGSGKSFFLGRLIEEIVLNTKCRCIIFDPNADYRMISEVLDEEYWKNASYDHNKESGYLPHERCRNEFLSKWDSLNKKIVGIPKYENNNFEKIRISWPSLSIEFLYEDISPSLRNDLYHCHEFVKAISELLKMRRIILTICNDNSIELKKTYPPTIDLIEEARKILNVIKGKDSKFVRELLDREFNRKQLVRKKGSLMDHPSGVWRMVGYPLVRDEIVQTEIDRAVAASEFLSEEAERYYFGRVKKYIAQNIVQTSIEDKDLCETNLSRIKVIHLPSVPDSESKLLVINSVLSTEWERARRERDDLYETDYDEDLRVPTFLIVDEAHNIMPKEARSLSVAALREQFRMIAAEGRKLGIFLIVCTQRPDKIDPLILSECENHAIMRLGSNSVLKITKDLLGLDDISSSMFDKCLKFKIGRTLLIGNWAEDGPQIMFCAMRRTVEGGKNLQPEYWTLPY